MCREATLDDATLATRDADDDETIATRDADVGVDDDDDAPAAGRDALATREGEEVDATTHGAADNYAADDYAPPRAALKSAYARPDDLDGTARYVVVALALATSCCLSGVVFGWSALIVMLKRDGAYSDRCGDDDDDGCAAQEVALAQVFTIGVLCMFAARLPLGVALDRFGPRARQRASERGAASSSRGTRLGSSVGNDDLTTALKPQERRSSRRSRAARPARSSSRRATTPRASR